MKSLNKLEFKRQNTKLETTVYTQKTSKTKKSPNKGTEAHLLLCGLYIPSETPLEKNNLFIARRCQLRQLLDQRWAFMSTPYLRTIARSGLNLRRPCVCCLIPEATCASVQLCLGGGTISIPAGSNKCSTLPLDSSLNLKRRMSSTHRLFFIIRLFQDYRQEKPQDNILSFTGWNHIFNQGSGSFMQEVC